MPNPQPDPRDKDWLDTLLRHMVKENKRRREAIANRLMGKFKQMEVERDGKGKGNSDKE